MILSFDWLSVTPVLPLPPGTITQECIVSVNNAYCIMESSCTNKPVICSVTRFDYGGSGHSLEGQSGTISVR